MGDDAQSNGQLVVIGSSAGGIEALSTLVATLPDNFPAPIVIAQHLDPSRQSHLNEILSRRTALAVRTVTEPQPLEPGVIYVVPSDRHVEITDHDVRLHPDGTQRAKPSVDLLLTSAANTYGEGLIAVILTGNGSDGAAGAREVSRAGGTVIIQNPETASYPDMPRSLAPTTVDIVADLETIGPILSDLLTGDDMPARANEERTLRALLEQLREHSGIDFTGYKAPTITRRLRRRMVATGTARLTDYIRYMQSHPEEYQRLVSSFLIKVTEFFRDTELYDYLRDHLLPELIAESQSRDKELRFWSAGTATGEEAYSLAILISEILGDRLDEYTVRIFATDLDGDAIAFARRGIYPAAALANLPEEYVDRYFNRVGGEFEVRQEVRALTVFGQHDLGQRAPFPRIDLTLCRNVLIYFTTELQKRALQLFAFSLRDGGYLVLGKAETTGPLAEYFIVEDQRLKVYRRRGSRILIPPGRIRDTTPMLPARLPMEMRSPAPVAPVRSGRSGEQPRSSRERSETLLRALPIGVIVVDRRYDIREINSAAQRLLGIHSTVIGEDLIHLAQNIPSAPLRAAIDKAFHGETPIVDDEGTAVEAATGGIRYLQILCYPQQMDTNNAPTDTVLITVTDITSTVQQWRTREQAMTRQNEEVDRLTALVKRLAETNRQLLEANQDLNVTNLELRGTNEEFLVATEEAQAAAEEIETLNEEIQATNEELETLNEELQATIEELNTTNDDLQARTIELQDLAAMLEEQRHESETEREQLAAILNNIGDAVLVLDRPGNPLLTNAAYEHLFGDASAPFVAEDENGQPLPPEETPQQRGARGDAFRMEFTTTRPDGRRWFEASGRPIDERGGVVVIRDITERSLRRLQDQFLAVASHELRTPLTGLSGYLQMLNRRLNAEEGADERAHRYATLALDQVQRLNGLVTELLDVARLQSGRLNLSREQMELAPVVMRVVETAQVLARGQTITLEAEEGPLRINGDAGRLEQVLLNLLTNAITYAPGTERIDVRLRRADDMAEIQVQDYGQGITPSELPHIFSRFYQIERGDRSPRSGLGLGLFIAREIVQTHDGTIAVHSTPGEGTTFTVRLPLEDGS